MKKPAKIHSTCNLWGKNSIGEGTTIGAFCDIGGAIIGMNCKIQAHVTIPPGTIIKNNVFIGPRVSFANDKYPVVENNGRWYQQGATVEDGATIGMGALIGPGVIVGKNAFIGMGAVVTKNVPDGEMWVGNPAKMITRKIAANGADEL